MIVGGWTFVWAAYAVAGVGLVGLVAFVLTRARHWARQERALDAVREARR
jgi:heme exporter protein CcmD